MLIWANSKIEINLKQNECFLVFVLNMMTHSLLYTQQICWYVIMVEILQLNFIIDSLLNWATFSYFPCVCLVFRRSKVYPNI